jgi:hypothetical protein
VAKHGHGRRRSHFAHAGLQACQSGFESAIHLRAKQLLLERQAVWLPAWDGGEAMPNPPVLTDAGGLRMEGVRVELPSEAVALTDVELEVDMGNYRPDVWARDHHGELLIEIRATHAVDALKALNVRNDGRRMLEIDLSGLSLGEIACPARFEQAVLRQGSNRHWVWHPAAVAAWKASYDALARKVQNQTITPRLDRRSKKIPAESRKRWLGRMPGLPRMVPTADYADPFIGQWIWQRDRGVGLVLAQVRRVGLVYRIWHAATGLGLVAFEWGEAVAWRLAQMPETLAHDIGPWP